jgi:hypothetical protein
MPTKAQLLDIAERCVRTFIATVSATMLSAAAGVTDWSTLRTAGFGALAAGLSAVLGLVTVHANDNPNNVSIISHD